MDNEQKHLPGKIWVPILVVAALIVAYLGIASAYDIWPFIQFSPPAAEQIGGDEEGVGEGELAGWQTYRNREFGFEVKYPNQFTVSEQISGGEELPILITTLTSPSEKIEISSYHRDFKDEAKGTLQNYPNCFKSFLTLDESLRKFVFDAKTIEKNQWTPCGNGWMMKRSEELIFVIPKEKTAILNQILSTFKFIEPEIDTSNWKTYRNEEYGFELKYPGDWKFDRFLQDFFDFSNPTGELFITISPSGGFGMGFPSDPPKVSTIKFGNTSAKLEEWSNFGVVTLLDPVPKWTNDNIVFNVEFKNNKQLLDQILSTFKFIE